MGKYKMPNSEEFFKRKTIYHKKRIPVWVYLEQEMLENAHRKPYNTKVGNWLEFLRNLKYHFYCESRSKYKRLAREVGPNWYFEVSHQQRAILDHLKRCIHDDRVSGVVKHVRSALLTFGITSNFPRKMLRNALRYSLGDPGLFLWRLYELFYKISPTELLPKYDLNKKLMMSALLIMDLEDCIKSLKELTKPLKPPPEPPKLSVIQKPPRKKPKLKYWMYLQEFKAGFWCPHPDALPEPKTPEPLPFKILLKSQGSYEALAKNTSFLENRRQKFLVEETPMRTCKYKFWEPPVDLRDSNPQQKRISLALKMFKMKPPLKALRANQMLDNCPMIFGTVTYSTGRAIHQLHTVATMPPTCKYHNGGLVLVKGDLVTHLLGLVMINNVPEGCDPPCSCVRWEQSAIKSLKETTCRCDHDYDFDVGGVRPESRYFYPSTKHTPFWVDLAKVYEVDPWVDFVCETVHSALLSSTPSPSPPEELDVENLSEQELLQVLLSKLSDSTLIIPHLPQASYVRSLQEWVRQRLHGKLSPDKHKELRLKSLRRWLDLKHMDFRARAYLIPFTLKELAHMDWSHRRMIQNLFHKLLSNFETRNRMKLVEQSQLLWATMYNEAYPNPKFLNVFFTYMPGRFRDTCVLNPYTPPAIQQFGKTCPLAKTH